MNRVFAIVGVSLALLLLVAALAFLSTNVGPRLRSTALAEEPALPENEDPPPAANDSADAAADPVARVAAPGSTSTTPACIVTVTDERGRPWKDARVLLLEIDQHPFFFLGVADPSNRLWTEARTDEHGRASFAAPDEPRVVVALVPERVPACGMVDAGASSEMLCISDELSLAGVVLVDELPAETPVELSIRGFTPPEAPTGVDLERLLSSIGAARARLRVHTAAQGRFEVRGLPPGESVIIEASEPMWARGGRAPEWGVRCGDTDLVLELVNPPLFDLRLVPPDGAQAAREELSLEFRLETADGAFVERGARAVPGATLRIPLDPDTARLSAVARQGEVVLARGSWSALARTGEFTVPMATSVLVLRVQDRAGNTLSGATALADGRRAGPSGPDGELRMEVTPSTAEVLVGCPGHATTSLAPPGPLPRRLTVVLEPANLLTIRVENLDPKANDLRVHVVVDPSFPRWGEALRRGPPPSEFGPDGTWEAFDLPTGAPVELTLADRHGNALCREPVRLEAGEHRTLVLRPDACEHSIAGRVVESDGRGVPGANVWLGQGFFPAATTDESGWFSIEKVFASAPTVQIRARGFAGLELQGPDVFHRHEFVLQAARSLWVEVHDALGPRDVAPFVLELDDGSRFGSVREGPGLYRFDDVPRRSGTLLCEEPFGQTFVLAAQDRVQLVLR